MAAPGADVIGFDAALAGRTISLASTIAINNAGGVTIDATGLPGGITINDWAAANYRLFEVQGGSHVTLRGLTFANGGGTSFTGNGAALSSASGSTVVAERCAFIGNETRNGDGGAIHSSGSMTLLNCTLVDNFAFGTARAGGAIFSALGTLTVTHCALVGNGAVGQGDGIFNNSGSGVKLTNSIVNEIPTATASRNTPNGSPSPTPRTPAAGSSSHR